MTPAPFDLMFASGVLNIILSALCWTQAKQIKHIRRILDYLRRKEQGRAGWHP